MSREDLTNARSLRDNQLTFYRKENNLIILKDSSYPNITFYGYAEIPFSNLENIEIEKTRPIWSIKRVTVTGGITSHFWAADGKFNQIWNERENLFPFLIPLNTASVEFDGIGAYLDGGDIFDFDVADAFSFSMWVKPNNLAATRILFSKATLDAAVDGYMLRHDITTGRLFLQMRASISDKNHLFDTALTANEWQLLVFTYNGGSNINGARVYRNKVKSLVNPNSGPLSGTMQSGQPFRIGQRNDAFFFSGLMDKITVWDKELTQEDVDELYNDGTPIYAPDHSAFANIVSNYDIDGDVYPDITCRIGGPPLAMVNMSEDNFSTDTP